MLGIATSGGHRGQTHLDWRLKALIFMLAATASGLACGALLAWLGGYLPAGTRVTGGSLAAVALLLVGLWHLAAQSPRMLERECQTAQSWLERGAVGWAVSNGLALGSGFYSRIGFVSWYAVPLTAVGFGDPVVGALVFGTYAATRGAAAGVWILLEWFFGDPNRRDLADRILAWNAPARPLSAALLVAFAMAAIVIVGF